MLQAAFLLLPSLAVLLFYALLLSLVLLLLFVLLPSFLQHKVSVQNFQF